MCIKHVFVHKNIFFHELYGLYMCHWRDLYEYVFLCFTITYCMLSVMLFSLTHSFCLCLDTHKKKTICTCACFDTSLWLHDLFCCSLGKEFLTRVKRAHTEIRNTSSSAQLKMLIVFTRVWFGTFKAVRTGTLWCQFYPLKVFQRTKSAMWTHMVHIHRTGFYLVSCWKRVCALINEVKISLSCFSNSRVR